MSGSNALDGGHVGGCGHVIDDRIEKVLNALILESRPAQHGIDLQPDGRFANTGLDLVDGQLLASEILLHQPLIMGGDLFDHLLTRLFGGGKQLVGDIDQFEFGSQGLIIPDRRFHFDQIDNATEAIFLADRKLNGHRVGMEAVPHHLHAAIEIGADAVHLIDEGNTGNMVLVGLTPDGFGLGLDPADRTENRHRAVKHLQRALHLDSEVDMTGSVDDIDAVVFPETGGRRGGDGNAALLLLLHPVHGGGAVMDFTDFMRNTGIVKNTLGRRRFAGVNVRHDADVSGFLKGY